MILKFPIMPNVKNDQYIYDLVVIENEAYTSVIPTLIDTGASIPVWVGGLPSFLTMFPDAKLIDDTESFMRGFGGNGEVAEVYNIPRFFLQDSLGNRIIFLNIPVTIIKRDYHFDMILSYTLLNKMNFNHLAYSVNDGIVIYIKQELNISAEKDSFNISYIRQPVSDIRSEYRDMFNAKYILDKTYVFTE